MMKWEKPVLGIQEPSSVVEVERLMELLRRVRFEIRCSRPSQALKLITNELDDE